MKVLILNGSPRKGNTCVAVNALQKGMDAAGGFEVMEIKANDMSVSGCIACMACECNGDCVFEDDTNDISSYLQKGQMYMSAEGRLRGIGEIIRNILERSPYYLTSVISFWALLKRENQYPSSIKAFFVLQIIIVLMSTAFLFTSKVISMEVIYIRFLRFAFIPTSILLAFLYENAYKHKYIKTVVGIAILGSVYSLLYSFYSSFSGII